MRAGRRPTSRPHSRSATWTRQSTRTSSSRTTSGMCPSASSHPSVRRFDTASGALTGLPSSEGWGPSKHVQLATQPRDTKQTYPWPVIGTSLSAELLRSVCAFQLVPSRTSRASNHRRRLMCASYPARAGNSPVQIHKDQLEELVPAWYDLALKFHKDPAASQAFGWIQEVRTAPQ